MLESDQATVDSAEFRKYAALNKSERHARYLLVLYLRWTRRNSTLRLCVNRI